HGALPAPLGAPARACRAVRLRRVDGVPPRGLTGARAGAGAHARRAFRPVTGVGLTDLAGAVREAAVLEGDFVLRSGPRSSYYLAKYRFRTRPDLLSAIGAAIAAAVRQHEPEAVRLAAPELGAVPLAAAASLELGLPFVIVRSKAKEYGTANRIEGVWEP